MSDPSKIPGDDETDLPLDVRRRHAERSVVRFAARVAIAAGHLVALADSGQAPSVRPDTVMADVQPGRVQIIAVFSTPALPGGEPKRVGEIRVVFEDASIWDAHVSTSPELAEFAPRIDAYVTGMKSFFS